MKTFVGILIGIALAAGVFYLRPDAAVSADAHPASTAVFKSRTLRCGYALVPPNLMKDPNTGQLSGTVYDIGNAIAEILGWKIEWAEEVPFATAIEGLQTHRYDVLCSALFARPNIMMQADFVGPFYYVPVNVYVKPGQENRFTDRAQMNDPSLRIGMIDGTIPHLIAQTDFPKAQMVNLPEMSDYAENMLLLTTGKADMTFVDSSVASNFLKQHPGAMVMAPAVSPLRVFPVIFAVNKGEQPLLNTLNAAVDYLHNNGRMQAILKKHDPDGNRFMRVAPRF